MLLQDEASCNDVEDAGPGDPRPGCDPSESIKHVYCRYTVNTQDYECTSEALAFMYCSGFNSYFWMVWVCS